MKHSLRTALPEVLLIEQQAFTDARGVFFESYNRRAFAGLLGRAEEFVQDNYSRSAARVLRGLHYQLVCPQGKLVTVLRGEIFDVAVDLRRTSKRFGAWAGFRLSENGPRSAWIPAGFAHGYLVLSDGADVLYKVTEFWHPEHERTIVWNDPDLAIEWPVAAAPLLSARDASGTRFKDAEVYP